MSPTNIILNPPPPQKKPLSPPKKEKEDTAPVELILYQSLAALMNSNNILYLMQVLASLQILDYIIVAFLPGISEVISKEKCFYHFCVCVFVFNYSSIKNALLHVLVHG